MSTRSSSFESATLARVKSYPKLLNILHSSGWTSDRHAPVSDDLYFALGDRGYFLDKNPYAGQFLALFAGISCELTRPGEAYRTRLDIGVIPTLIAALEALHLESTCLFIERLAASTSVIPIATHSNLTLFVDETGQSIALASEFGGYINSASPIDIFNWILFKDNASSIRIENIPPDERPPPF